MTIDPKREPDQVKLFWLCVLFRHARRLGRYPGLSTAFELHDDLERIADRVDRIPLERQLFFALGLGVGVLSELVKEALR